MAPAKLTCLLFDLDGTLVDTTDLIFTSYRYALQQVLGMTPSDEALLAQHGRPLAYALGELARATLGQRPAATLEQAVEAEPVEPAPQRDRRVGPPEQALVETLVRVYREHNLKHHDQLIRCFPGASETVAALRARGYLLGVVTSKSRLTAELSMARCRLSEYMSATITLEDVTAHKPDPAPLLVALRRLGRRSEEALYLGDSTLDILAARAAGLRSAAALWGAFPRAELLALTPDYALESVEQLLDVCPPLNEG